MAERDEHGRFLSKGEKKGGVRFTGPWQLWGELIEPGDFDRRLRRNVGAATRKNALLVVRAIRERIQDRRYAENSILTLAAKAPKDKPLVDAGALFGAITHVMLDDYRAFVGVKRSARGPDGESLANVGEVLHEGRTWQPSRAQVAAVMIKARENKAGAKMLDATPPSGGSKTWVIPGRPFIRDVIEDAGLARDIEENWRAAVAKTLAGR